MPETANALDIMLALVLITSPFWIPALIIGYLMRNRRAESQERSNMKDRLEIALGAQRLQNMRREQLLEDELHDMKRAKLGDLRGSRRRREVEVERVDDYDEDYEDYEEIEKAPLPRRKDVKALRQDKGKAVIKGRPKP